MLNLRFCISISLEMPRYYHLKFKGAGVFLVPLNLPRVIISDVIQTNFSPGRHSGIAAGEC